MPDAVPPGDEITPGSGAIAHEWFPAGPAEGKACLARNEEFRRLFDDCRSGRNRWFDCPARFGVGTVLRRVRSALRHNYRPRMNSHECELRGIHDTEAYATTVLTAFGQVAAQVIRRHAVFEENIAPLFPGTPKEIYMDENYLQTIRFLPEDDPLQALQRIGEQLEQLTVHEQCRNLLVVRDCEQLLALRERSRVGAVTAQLVGISAHTSWFFQGNNQHAMRTMFGVDDSPLRESCLRFALRPVDAAIYSEHIAEAAKARWECLVGRKATKMILALTRRHPYWVNALCRRLWCRDLPPLIQNVVTAWNGLAAYHRHRHVRELERLSSNQRSVLLTLAATPTDQPRAKRFVRRTRVSSASVGQAIRILAEQDLIDTDAEGLWRVKDPLMQWSLSPQRDLVAAIYEGRPWPV